MKRKTLLNLKKKSLARKHILDGVFANFYSTSLMEVKDAVRILLPYKGVIRQHLIWLQKYDLHKGWIPLDYRSGEETYGFKDEESILGNLMYISDRYSAQFRLQWVLDLIERYRQDKF